jgi:hypothetical protein
MSMIIGPNAKINERIRVAGREAMKASEAKAAEVASSKLAAKEAAAPSKPSEPEPEPAEA